jgi:hypothetical protein
MPTVEGLTWNNDEITVTGTTGEPTLSAKIHKSISLESKIISRLESFHSVRKLVWNPEEPSQKSGKGLSSVT